jgi:hypothetical protein
LPQTQQSCHRGQLGVKMVAKRMRAVMQKTYLNGAKH